MRQTRLIVLLCLSFSVLSCKKTPPPSEATSFIHDRDFVKQYLHEANEGDANSMFMLSLAYQRCGDSGCVQCYSEALKWFRKSADQGNTDALFALAFAYEHGTMGVLQDDSEADRLYRQFQSQAELDEYRRLCKAAEQEDMFAQHNLGNLYASGRGVLQNDKQAVKWYAKAAEQGLASSQYELGLAYANGRGVIEDYKEAIKWYTKAAEQGYEDAQFNLGAMYANGVGATKDSVEAYKWALLAGMNGHDVAEFKDWLKEQMTSEQIAEAQKQAKAFVAKKENKEL